MRYILRLLLGLSALVLTACSVSGNITDMTIRTSVVSVGQLTGLVQGGSVQTTAGGYQVISTLGDPVASIQSTSSGGYTLFSNVSGNIVSSGVITTIQ